MNIISPSNPIFAHSENKIYVSGVDQYISCLFEIKTAGTTKTFENTVYAYNDKAELDLSEILKMFYYRLEQSLPFYDDEYITGDNSYNGGELKITLSDFSQNTEVLNYYVINGGLQISESFIKEDQFLNQIPIHFKGYPKDASKYLSELNLIKRSKFYQFPLSAKCKGIYVAWLNKYGVFDYWLFDGVPELDFNASNLDNFRGFSLGKKSNRQIKIRTKINEDLENYSVQKIDVQKTAKKITEAILGIVESPEVYIFRNKSISQSLGDFNNDFSSDFSINPDYIIEGVFIKVKDVKGSSKLKFNEQVTPIEFELTLPDENNIVAI